MILFLIFWRILDPNSIELTSRNPTPIWASSKVNRGLWVIESFNPDPKAQKAISAYRYQDQGETPEACKWLRWGPALVLEILFPTARPGRCWKRLGRTRWSLGVTGSIQCSQRSGGPGGPTGRLPIGLDRTGRQSLLRPVLGHFRTAGLSKDHGPHKVRHYYAVPIKGPQGTVVDCRSPDKDGGDL